MSAEIIDGKKVAAQVRAEVSGRVARLAALGREVGLDVVLVGEDPASAVYVRNKVSACGQVGLRSRVHGLPESVPEADILALIGRLNDDPTVDGILVQMPLPPQVDTARCVAAVRPDKDVDGFTTLNMGRLMTGEASLPPCTPQGVLRLLDAYGIPVTGRHTVVVGVGHVGKPLSVMLMERRATVTVCHSRTAELGAITRQADILVAAAGRPRLVTADMVRPGATVIDVGIHRLPEGGLCGDVDFDRVREVAGWITPVPGGVGPMTVAMLLANTVRAAERTHG